MTRGVRVTKFGDEVPCGPSTCQSGAGSETDETIDMATTSDLPLRLNEPREKSFTRPITSPSAMGRALNHRPSPLNLPATSFGEHRAARDHGNLQQNDCNGIASDNTVFQVGHKRSAPFDLIHGRRLSKDSSNDDDGDEELESFQYSTPPLQTPLRTPNTSGIQQHVPVCLCLRPLKVPRPRNSFMLYRQHYQSQVVADNPGLANPDISKIIGQMWREKSEDEKNYWKQMAEQEKINHQKKYPDYRFQPRRGGKGRLPSGRLGTSIDGEAGFDGSRFPGANGKRDSKVDQERCGKCGGCYPASQSSARLVPNSARALGPLPSPFGAGSSSISSTPFDSSRSNSDQYEVPLTRSRLEKISGNQVDDGRHRTLPQRPRPDFQGNDHGDFPGFHALSDPKRQRYESSTPRSSQFPLVNGDTEGRGSNVGRPATRLAHGSHHQGVSSPRAQQLPSSAPLPQHLSETSTVQASASSWMGPPSLPLRQEGRGYGPMPSPQRHAYPESHGSQASLSARLPGTPHSRISHPGNIRQGHPDDSGTYGTMPARLPPLQGPYNYYQAPGSDGSASNTPLTTIAKLSIRPPPTPPSIISATRRSVVGKGSDRYAQRLEPTSSFSDESLKLPPLQNGTSHTLQNSNRHKLPESGLGSGQLRSYEDHMVGRREPSPLRGRMVSDRAMLPISTARLQDLQGSIASPIAFPEGQESSIDKDSQASGIRAMVMSVPYLNKLEVLRRISPPQPLVPKRGPIISIEGNNPVLVEAVGRVVENALLQSGEFSVAIWSTEAGGSDHYGRAVNSCKTNGTDSGVGSVNGAQTDTKNNILPSTNLAVDGLLRGTAKDNSPCSTSSTSSPLLAYLELIMSWHAKSRTIMKHIATLGSSAPRTHVVGVEAVGNSTGGKLKTGSGASTPLTELQSTPRVAAPPSPASLSPGAAPTAAKSTAGSISGERQAQSTTGETVSSSCTTSPRNSPHPPTGATLSAASLAHTQSSLLPVALITGGYSLAISDKYAMAVPIDDAYPPIGHWEWMATHWRGIAGPDLVVYTDATAPAGTNDASVNTRVQEGVIVVHAHVPKSLEKADGYDLAGVIERKTERRLAFEVMEWIRNGNFGMC